MFKKFLDKAKEVISTIAADFNVNPEGEQDPHKLWLLTLAAPIANSGWHYINSLETGSDKDDLIDGLGEWWGITSKESAKSTIDYLIKEGHRLVYPAARDIFNKPGQSGMAGKMQDMVIAQTGAQLENPEETLALVASLTTLQEPEEALDRLKSMIQNWAASKKDLKKDHGIDDAALERGILAWDAGRVVILARQCYDCGLLTVDEAWTAMQQLAPEIKSTFNSWEQYWQSFILGRTLWSGDDESYEDMCDEGKTLLNKEDSPFKTVAW